MRRTLSRLESRRAHEAVAVVAAGGDVEQSVREALSDCVLQEGDELLASKAKVIDLTHQLSVKETNWRTVLLQPEEVRTK